MELNDYISVLLEFGKEYEDLNIFCYHETLSKTEFRLLREVALEQKKGNRMISADLAKRLGITRSAVSQIVTRLEKKQLLKRVSAEDDRKIAYIEFSKKALELYERQNSRVNEFVSSVVDRFGEERLNAFIAEYHSLTQVLQELWNENRNEIKGV